MDYNATTPLDPRVNQAMEPYLAEHFGNASSSSHPFGWRAQMGVEKARAQVAKLLNAKPSEVLFTSGATESNNLAIIGSLLHMMRQPKESGGRPPHFITSNYEHKAVLEVFERLRLFGAQTTILNVSEEGLVDPKDLKKALRPETHLVSIMGANNEVGSINPIEELAQLCLDREVLFHTDCAQLIGRQNIDFSHPALSMLSLSGHKIYGPRGVGALVIKEKAQKKISPVIVGGEQEKGLRPGTLNVPGIVGLGEACEIMMESMDAEIQRLKSFQNQFFRWAKNNEKDVAINGSENSRLCNNISFSFKTLPSDRLRNALKTVAFSSGSACTSASAKPSHVLMALGRSEKMAQQTLRLGLGRLTTEEDVNQVLQQLQNALG